MIERDPSMLVRRLPQPLFALALAAGVLMIIDDVWAQTSLTQSSSNTMAVERMPKPNDPAIQAGDPSVNQPPTVTSPPKAPNASTDVLDLQLKDIQKDLKSKQTGDVSEKLPVIIKPKR
jgi:hypothetical protein